MPLRESSARLTSRLRHPRTTVRWRLTLLYGGLFLASGAALLAITYTLVERAPVSGPIRSFVRAQGPALPNFPPPNATIRETVRGQQKVPPAVTRLLGSKAGRNAVLFVGSDQRVADLHQLVIESAIALAIMAVISTALGWVVAGRVLAPLRTMTAATREISAANLHERLAMAGPRDELRQLADTIDGLLGRLEGAFEAQRRFVANASHELRTPLTAVRAMLEMAITDPHATVESFRITCRHALEEGDRQEELIDALLALAQGQRGIDRRERIDLAEVVERVVAAHRAEAIARGLDLGVSLAKPVPVSGDPRLIERLVTNLLENALHHNVPDGRVRVHVEAAADEGTLTISNTGLVVPADEVARLLQPFQRLAPDRVGHRGGLGLGLSIVAAIATAHDGALAVRPDADGGLAVEVRLPAGPPEDMRPSPQPEPALSAD